MSVPTPRHLTPNIHRPPTTRMPATHQTSQPSAMHRALEMRDILDAIFRFLSQDELAPICSTSSAFYSSAVPLRWRCINEKGVVHLALLVFGDRMDPAHQLLLTDSEIELLLNKFHGYASFVRELDVDVTFPRGVGAPIRAPSMRRRRHAKEAAINCITALGSLTHKLGQHVFPNVVRLSLKDNGHSHSHLVLHLAHRGLQTLELYLKDALVRRNLSVDLPTAFENIPDMDTTVAMLDTLPSITPFLRELRIDPANGLPTGTISRLILLLPHLEAIKLYGINSAACFQALGPHKHLARANIRLTGQIPLLGERVVGASEICPAMEEMHLTYHCLLVDGQVLFRALPRRLRTLNLVYHLIGERSQHADFVRSIPDFFPALRKVGLAIHLDSNTRLYWELFSGILGCRSLESFTLLSVGPGTVIYRKNDIRAMAKAWPSLRKLHLRSDIYSSRNESAAIAYSCSLRGLLELISRCPYLDSIDLDYVDASTPLPGMPFRTESSGAPLLIELRGGRLQEPIQAALYLWRTRPGVEIQVATRTGDVDEDKWSQLRLLLQGLRLVSHNLGESVQV
ncbi:hypothetical protein CALVIDRAFT_205535 [Calocera viscosa TUFC12733]|uniref:F-box domain-containing protein n=1 Tax=Calocera viscosa (strain TUFC12733) TaxID=1330018 RepID=A0A167KDZ2_CALVF|nr:hypothetical protein CALVIDRAFT_205535 [Calocera viscosa TUFC12733]